GGREETSRAGKALATTPEQSVPFLSDRLRRAAALEGRAHRFIANLDDDDFEVREKASRDLEALGPEAAVPLRLAPPGSPRVEVRNRIRRVLDKLKPSAGEDLQPRSVVPALAVLEEVGSPAARQTLEELAKGPSGSVVAHEARKALVRLAKRPRP